MCATSARAVWPGAQCTSPPLPERRVVPTSGARRERVALPTEDSPATESELGRGHRGPPAVARCVGDSSTARTSGRPDDCERPRSPASRSRLPFANHPTGVTAIPRATGPLSRGEAVAVGTVAAPVVDGVVRGPRGAELPVTGSILRASPAGKLASTSSRPERTDHDRQVQSGQQVRSYWQAQVRLFDESMKMVSLLAAALVLAVAVISARHHSRRSGHSRPFRKDSRLSVGKSTCPRSSSAASAAVWNVRVS